MLIWKTSNSDQKGAERMAPTNMETRMMWDAGDLRRDFNILMNNTFCLTNNIKLLSEQTLQHGQKADLGVGSDILLLFVAADACHSFSPLPSACLGRRNQMVVAS